MVRNANKIPQNIYISIIMLIAIFTQIVFLTNGDGYYIVFIPAGIAAGFYVTFGKRVFPGIALSTFFGVFIFSYIFTSKDFYASLLYTTPVFFANVTVAYLINLFLTYFNCKRPDTLKKGTYYLLSVLVATFIVSLFPTIQYTIQNNSRFILELGKVYQPVFIGVVIFATTIILSNHYDELVTRKSFMNYRDIIFIFAFAGTTYLIFGRDIGGLSFGSYGSLFIILFMINAFAFNYRMLLFNSFIYILIYSNTYLKVINPEEALSQSGVLNSYLLILLVITIFTKVLVTEIQEKNNELTETKDRFAGMLDSTISLLSVRDTLDYENEDYHENYIKSIFDIAMKIFPEITNGTCGLIDNRELRTLNTKGYDLTFFKSLKFPLNQFTQDVYEPILNRNTDKVFADAFGEKYELLKDELPKIKESIIILIKLSEKSKGVIIFDILKNSKDNFTENDINNIGAFQNMINSFYEMNELAIRNNNLKDDIVLSLIRTLELYDHYTGGHSEDVATLGKLLAEKINLSDSDIYDVYWAGIVHDIGKIGINSDIINKPTKLTLDEYKQVQLHPIYGFDILNRSLELKTIANLVKHHHEWYNGSGYPEGLKGNQIPFGSQILQVADSVSSMATKRSYQDQKSFDEVITELEMYKGTQFNPEICDHMIDLIKSGIIENYFNSKQQK